MALTPLNFPNAPTIGQTYPSPPVTGQPTYIWDGVDWLAYFALGKAYVPLDGSQPMTGLLTLSGDPTAPLHATTKQYTDARDNAIAAATVIRSYLAGLALSTPGASINFTVQPGVAADSTNVVMLALSAALTKTTAAWVAGAGGALDTGVIAALTWYHVHLIRRPDTGVVDVLLSLSATAPTLPASYTQFRRIGSMRANASSQWTLFHQLGDEFIWDAPAVDLATTIPATTAQTVTLTVPAGIQVWALFEWAAAATAGNIGVLLSSLDQADQASFGAPYTDGSSIWVSFGSTANYAQGATQRRRTDTLGRIRWRASATTGRISIYTFGWIDRRGSDA